MTTEKVYLLHGTVHRRAKAVHLKKIEAVEIDQSLLGQLFGYEQCSSGRSRSATSLTQRPLRPGRAARLVS